MEPAAPAEFTTADGRRWIWDPSSHSYVEAPVDPHPVGRNHWDGTDQQYRSDPDVQSEWPSSPMTEGVLAHAQGERCEHCGQPLGENTACNNCLNWAQEFRNHPQPSGDTGPYADAVPKNDWSKMDQSFPSSLASASLDSCPNCHSPNMRDHGDERICLDCDTRQPIIQLESSMDHKHADAADLAAAGGAAAGMGAALAPETLGLSEAPAAALEGAAGVEEAAPALAEVAPVAEQAAGDLAGDASAVGKGLWSGAKDLMGGAMSKGKGAIGDLAKFHGMQDLAGGAAHMLGMGGGSSSGMPETSLSDQVDNGIGMNNQSSITAHFFHLADESDANDDDDVFSNDDTNAADPKETDNQDFLVEFGDSPELFKDTDGGGGSKGIPDQDVETTFKHMLPLVMHYFNSDEDGSDNPVMKALDKMLSEHADGYDESKADNDSARGKDKESSLRQSDLLSKDPDEKTVDACPQCGALGPCSHRPNATPAGQPVPAGTAGMSNSTPVVSHIMAEKISARKPKMCAFHNDLVDYALTLGDPAAALQSIKPVDYGQAYCHSDGHEGKCNYKPAMVSQSYWDAKDEAAAERKQEREQAAQEQAVPEQVNPDPEDIIFDDPSLDNDVLHDIGEGYSPSADNQESAVGTGEPADPLPAIAASVRSADFKDTTGKPLEPGKTYLLKEQNFAIPDRITVDDVTPEKLSYTLKTDLLQYQQIMSSHEAADERFTFEPVDSEDPEPDSVTEGFGPVESSRRPQTVQTQNKTAGRAFSPAEQRQFIDEPGIARNLGSIDTRGTHYDRRDIERALSNDISAATIFGW